MNERLQGWRLALALLIPAAIVGAAAYIAYGALTTDDQDVATSTEQVVATATAVPLTEPVDTTDAEPTQPAAPTPLTVPTTDPASLPAPTAEPAQAETIDSDTEDSDADAESATPEPAPAATAVPAPAATAVSGPTATPTPDPSVLSVACSGALPETADTATEFGPINAVTTPPELADSYRFVWDFDNGTVVTNPNSGTFSYDAPGTYTISVTGTSSTGGETLTADCGTITVGETLTPFRVTCTVTPTNAEIRLADSRPPDQMTVTTSWSPIDRPLILTYEFDTEDALVIVDNASSGNQQTRSFASDDSTFSIFWRDPDTGETGLLSCPAYPAKAAATPTPTVIAGADTDEDGIEDLLDNCPADENADQLNTDGDSEGNVCDDDDDNDNRVDIFDNCPLAVNFEQTDSNNNGIGDACEVAPTPTATTEGA